MKIRRAETPEEIEEVRRLFGEYEDHLGVDLCFQNFEEELAGLPGKYGPPNGTLLIGFKEGEAAGCVALRELGPGLCEMKRLFVRPEYRGAGFGRLLALTAIDTARKLGYSVMRLDTLDKLKEAMRLYESLGFRRTEPYYENPLPGAVYWELDL